MFDYSMYYKYLIINESYIQLRKPTSIGYDERFFITYEEQHNKGHIYRKSQFIGCRKSTFVGDVKEQHAYSAAIETWLVCKH